MPSQLSLWRAVRRHGVGSERYALGHGATVPSAASAICKLGGVTGLRPWGLLMRSLPRGPPRSLMAPGLAVGVTPHTVSSHTPQTIQTIQTIQ